MGVSRCGRRVPGTAASRGAAIAVFLVVASAGCGGGDTENSAATTAPTPATGSANPLTVPPTTQPGPGALQLQQQYEQVVRQVLPSLVQITTDDGSASGVVFDTQGSIVTNAHVVVGAKDIRVTPATGGQAAPATVLGTFVPDDLAVLRAPALTLRPARFGDSGRLQVGQLVLAMGNPLGLSGSVTNGIVSAKGRTVTTARQGEFPGSTIANAIQTNAEINPGNSGGALAALNGEIIGIPVAGARDPALGSAAPGIGFAVPSNTVNRIAPQLIQHGRVTDSGRAALGVTVRTVIDPATLQPGGAQIVSVEKDGPAAKAGMTPGDVILSLDRVPTPDQAALAEALALQAPGDQVDVVLQPASGQNRTVQVVLGKMPGS